MNRSEGQDAFGEAIQEIITMWDSNGLSLEALFKRTRQLRELYDERSSVEVELNCPRCTEFIRMKVEL